MKTLTIEQARKLAELNDKVYNLWDHIWSYVPELPDPVKLDLDAMEGYLLQADEILDSHKGPNKIDIALQDLDKMSKGLEQEILKITNDFKVAHNL